MSAAFLLPWSAELVLELAGAYLALRSKLYSLLAILIFGVVSDLIAGVARVSSPDAMGWAGWIQLPIQCVLLCWLGCEICGKLVAERRQATIFRSAIVLSVACGICAMLAWSEAHTLADKLLDAEMAADGVLLIAVGVGWMTRIQYLKAPWTWLAAGFLVKVGSDIICSFLFEHWPGAQYLYSIGEIATLLLWGIGAAGNLRLNEWRDRIGKSIPVTSVATQAKAQRWVM